MSLYKIFDKTRLVQETSAYIFSIVWATEGICSLYLLQGKTVTGNWHQIITRGIADSDGEISVKIGDFRIGIDVTIAFGALAMTDLNEVAVFVTNRNTGESRKMKPAHDDTKTIKKSDSWDDSFTFTTF